MRKMYYASLVLYMCAAIIILASGGKTVIGEAEVFGESLQANRTWIELLGVLSWAFVPESLAMAGQFICRNRKKSYGMFWVNTILRLLHEMVSPALMLAMGGMLFVGIPGIKDGNPWGKGLLWLSAVHMVGYAVYTLISGFRKELREIRLLIQEEEDMYEQSQNECI